MATPCPFGVVGVNGTSTNRFERIFYKARLVERVGMNRNLHVKLVCNVQAVANRRWGGTPIFMKLEPHGASA